MLAQELAADPKEIAEHVMLLDLGRNDVGRVAQTGSVRVTERMVIERYSHVMHIVSNVEGTLKPGLTSIDVLRATFPAGTVSGAPKVRAMEIIDELEPTRRGIYSGAVGLPQLPGRHGYRDRAAHGGDQGRHCSTCRRAAASCTIRRRTANGRRRSTSSARCCARRRWCSRAWTRSHDQRGIPCSGIQPNPTCFCYRPLAVIT